MIFTRNHSETHFYKYVKAETAKLILQEGYFIAQCPLKFNDPFDVQTGLHYGFDVNSLPDLFYEELALLINAEKEPEFKNSNSFSEFVLRLRRAKGTLGISKEQLIQETILPFTKLAATLDILRQDFVKTQTALMKRMRILCLSETFDNVLMWSHYANNHTGVVIKLKVAETAYEDDPLWNASKVVYSPSAIPLISKRQMLDQFFGIRNIDAGILSEQLACTKFDVWEYEREWRIWDIAQEGNDSDYFIGINLKRFEAIYFGVRTEQKHIDEIRKIATSKNSGIEFYQAKKHLTDFKLEFAKI